MSDTQDIRVWAQANGYDVAARGRLPRDVIDAHTAAQTPDDDTGDDIPDEPFVITPTPSQAAADTPTPPADPERRPEPAPRPRRRGLFSQPKTPGGHRRVSIENVLSSGWALGAMALARSPQAIPVARVMQMQAPVAGVIGEDLLRGTLVDRILQPFARGGKKAEMGMALAGPPLLVGIMTAHPELVPVLRPALKMTMMTWMEISEPAMKKVQKRQETWVERFGDVDLDAMIDGLWADMPAAGPVSAQEEEHIRRARGE